VFHQGAGSIADGLLAVRIGTLNFAHHEAFLDDVVTVDDGTIRCAMQYLLERSKLVAEPSGAVTVAALLATPSLAQGDTVAVLSGGNIEWPGLLAELGGRA
jgi:threonine dehydratase